MHMYDILAKKREGLALTERKSSFSSGAMLPPGRSPTIRRAALLMAICIQGMMPRETADLTLSMAHSGEMADFPKSPGSKGTNTAPAAWGIRPL